MYRRFHLFEFNESPWFPQMLRDFETDYLETLFRTTDLFRGVPTLLADLLRSSGERRIVDLCSGAGGPLPVMIGRVAELLRDDVELVLTDKYPNLPAFQYLVSQGGGRVSYVERPIDVLAEAPSMSGVHTLCDTLHHFEVDDVRRLLERLSGARVPVMIVDAAARRWPHLLGSVLIPPMVLALTPRVRPFRWQRWLYTYLLPVLPLAIGWDGLVSHLRAHRPEELEALVAELQRPDYRWQVQELRNGPAYLTVVIGQPTATPAGDDDQPTERSPKSVPSRSQTRGSSVSAASGSETMPR